MADIRVDTASPNNSAGIYDAGDNQGGLQTFQNFVQVAGAYCRIRSIMYRDLINARPEITLLFFSANPTLSTITDNAPIVIHADDQAKIFHEETIKPGDWTNLGTTAIYSRDNIAKAAFLADTSLRMVVLHRRRCLYASGTDNVRIRIEVESG